MHGLVSSYMSCLQRSEKTFWKRCENRNRLSGQHRYSKPLYMQVKQPLCSGEIKKKNKLTKENNFLRLLSYQLWSSEKSDRFPEDVSNACHLFLHKSHKQRICDLSSVRMSNEIIQLKVRQFQNEFMKSSFLPKYNKKLSGFLPV